VPSDTASHTRQARAKITLVEIEAGEPLLYAALLGHPHAFEAGAMEKLMRSFYFSPKDVISWAEPRPVFSGQEVEEIAPLIREAFVQAKPYQKIQLEVRTPKGPTVGDLFIMDGEVHWRCEAIQGTDHFEEFESPFQFESETSVTPNWILRPQDRQRYYSRELVLGIKRETKNWLVLAREEQEDPTLARPRHGEQRKSLTGRLHLLQELKATKLITEGDYEKKVQALLAEAAHDEMPVPDRLNFLKQLREEGVISDAEYESWKQEVLDQI
jgi:hypothetical protein